MTRRLRNVTPFSRDYRRPPRWNMGGPRRPRRRPDLRDPRHWLKLVILGAAAGLFILPMVADGLNAATKSDAAGGCRVIKVIDGDTVLLWCPGRSVTKARLKGFDAPEVFSPRCLSEWTAGVAATWHLRRLMFGADKLTVGFAGTDRYGRDLVSLAVDGRSIAGQMIAAGRARPYGGGQRQGWCA